MTRARVEMMLERQSRNRRRKRARHQQNGCLVPFILMVAIPAAFLLLGVT